jgi:hypothetical protein
MARVPGLKPRAMNPMPLWGTSASPSEWLSGFSVQCQITLRSSALHPVSGRRVRVLPPASSRPCLATTPLSSANSSDQYGLFGTCTLKNYSMPGTLKKPKVKFLPSALIDTKPTTSFVDGSKIIFCSDVPACCLCLNSLCHFPFFTTDTGQPNEPRSQQQHGRRFWNRCAD